MHYMFCQTEEIKKKKKSTLNTLFLKSSSHQVGCFYQHFFSLQRKNGDVANAFLWMEGK